MNSASLSLDDGSLAEVVDRLLETGAVAAGDVVIGLAGVDLVRLNLRLLLASVETLAAGDSDRSDALYVSEGPHPGHRSAAASSLQTFSRSTGRDPDPTLAPVPRERASGPLTADPPLVSDLHGSGSPDHGVGRLVLAVIELLRQVLERQALRRMETGSLTEAEIERLGSALMALERRVAELAEVFGVHEQDDTFPIGALASIADNRR